MVEAGCLTVARNGIASIWVVVGRGWLLALVAAAALAVVSLASNVTTVSQLSGEANTLLAVRSTISKVVNAGAVWAGLPILSGWLVRRPLQTAAAGMVCGLTSLVVHYGLGQLFGVFGSDIWVSNAFWFLAAVVLGGPLGLVGAIARRSDWWGLLGRLTVPVGAVLQPFVLGMFTTPAFLPWPDRLSSTVSGVVLLTAGVLSGVKILARPTRRHRRTNEVPDEPSRARSTTTGA